ncbi:hypothetical protein Taro_023507 [Colocasia esculenta]|uniref:SUF system FeS cluster assembly SufBD core domain-containing protein n=1 Tax=Colocasia esculenta TaxID=4460 RepID=A0A843V4D2_COLES|nr:hypothetical protein [Colocasia esculenta]
MSSCCCGSPSLPASASSRRLRRAPAVKFRPAAVRCSLSDPFVLEIAEKLEDSLSVAPRAAPAPPSLQRLRDASSQSLLSRSWPSLKDEPFRFTDTSFLRQSRILPASGPSIDLPPFAAGSASPHLLAVVDGLVVPSLSRFSSLPQGVCVGGVSDAPSGPVSERVLEVLALGDAFQGRDLFWDINGAGAPDLAVVYVPSGVRMVEEPLVVRFVSLESADAGSNSLFVSNPRMVVVVEKGAEVAIVEEHLGAEGSDGKCYWANSVMEIVVGEGAKVFHSYVQQQSSNAAHIKWTFTRQESSSTYELIEISTGARLSRHNLHIQQMGPDTTTELSSFHISQTNQTHDLHSKLVLDHPRGYSRQLHKCIVTHSSGHSVFDGNIKVNRYAQQTDAGQLTRSLLLAPRATVNVKPNLQIIADDVKCSHGAAISDLEEDQLFYFRARGIDSETARDALIFSFGAEVLARLPFEPIRKKVASHIRDLLAAKKP